MTACKVLLWVFGQPRQFWTYSYTSNADLTAEPVNERATEASLSKWWCPKELAAIHGTASGSQKEDDGDGDGDDDNR